jgi:hypothetical protein
VPTWRKTNGSLPGIESGVISVFFPDADSASADFTECLTLEAVAGAAVSFGTAKSAVVPQVLSSSTTPSVVEMAEVVFMFR